MPNKILMVGWEYPPNNSGGLGVACQGIVENLVDNGEVVTLVLPSMLMDEAISKEVRKTPKGNVYDVILVKSVLRPYVGLDGVTYSGELTHDVAEYAKMVVKSVEGLSFDLIHAHDWLTVPAATALKEKYRKPLVWHVHSLEYDRTAGTGHNEKISAIEKKGVSVSDLVITVSSYTKSVLVKEYGIAAEKIVVIHNGVESVETSKEIESDFLKGSPVIIFVGRLTVQKGPEYFIEVARGVIDRRPDAVFIFAGDGEMMQRLLLTSAYKNLSGSVLFAGFLRDVAKEKLYKRADIFMMPSVSEPFGIVALEAAMANTPVIVSKTSGVTEVLPSAIQIDFWDVQVMIDKVLEIIEQTDYKRDLGERLKNEAGAVTWGKTAIKIREAYCQLLNTK